MALSTAAKQRNKKQTQRRDLSPVEIDRIKSMRAAGSTLSLIARSMDLTIQRVEFVLSGASPYLERFTAFSPQWHSKFGVQVLRGKVEPIAGPLRIGTDASLAGPLASFGFVDTWGNWAVYAFEAETKTTSSNLEMAAISAGLHGLGMHDQPHVLTDSHGAMTILRRWQQGQGKEPVADPVLSPVLTRLHRGLHGVGKRWHQVQIDHVHGHRGHLLNEAADAVAKLGRRSLLSAQIGERTAHERGQHLVRGFLDAVAAQG